MDSSLHRWRPVIANVSFLVLTVALLAGVVYLLKDFLHAIILGALLAGILLPVHHWILRRCAEASQWAHRAWRGLRRSPAPGEGPAEPSLRLRRMAACCSVALVFILVVVPLGVFAVQAADQGIRAIPVVQKWLREDLEGKTADFLDKHPRFREGLRKMTWGTGLLAEGGLFPAREPAAKAEEEAHLPGQGQETIREETETPARELLPSTEEATPGLDLAPMAIRLGTITLQWLRDLLLELLSRTWVTVFNFLIMLFVMYYVFLDGEGLVAYLKEISPLNEEEMEPVSQRIRQVSQAILYSTLGTAVIQGALAMLLFRLVGVPALFWGALLGVCSIVPFVGTGLVWVPVTAYLFLAGQPGKAVFILLACGGLVSNVDSLLRPFLMKKGGDTGMSYPALFFAILGGLQTFGVVGIIYGPLIMGICGVCLLIFSTRLKRKDTPCPPPESPQPMKNREIPPGGT